jgi:hypothetical protein
MRARFVAAGERWMIGLLEGDAGGGREPPSVPGFSCHAALFRKSRVKSSTVTILLAVIAVAALLTAATWYRANSALSDSRTQFLGSTLRPLAAMLKENQTLLKELQAEPFTEKDSGIMESYLAKIRRDGVAKHADMKQRLDQLAENNSAIVTLIGAYSPQAKTAAFSVEAEKFQHYAIAWRDRWNSVMELFMAGGNYPAAEVPYPREFVGAVQTEMEAAKHAM